MIMALFEEVCDDDLGDDDLINSIIAMCAIWFGVVKKRVRRLVLVC